LWLGISDFLPAPTLQYYPNSYCSRPFRDYIKCHCLPYLQFYHFYDLVV
jgi:hypothetical protein